MAKAGRRGRKAPPRARRKALAPAKPAASLKHQLAEARAQQKATAEILRAMASSPSDAQPVFDAIARNVVRLLGTQFSAVQQLRGDSLHLVGFTGFGFEKLKEFFPQALGSEGAGTTSARTRKVVQFAPILGNPKAPKRSRNLAKTFGYNAIIGVPLVQKNKAIGAIATAKRDEAPFDARQIELLKAFADQAVIAIENVRLFNETKESLERQTAIGEILRVISGSPSDVQPVLDAVAMRAARICDAGVVDIVLRRGETLDVAATYGDLGRPIGLAVPLNRGTVMGRSVVDGKAVQVADLQNADGEFALGRELALKYGHRSILAVPLMREGRALGTILVRRAEVRSFDEKHVALLQTFADQAAIAIENVRLFNETKEALERQTATAEILKVISESPTDTQPVFEAIARRAVTLSDGDAGIVTRFDGEQIHIAAIFAARLSEAQFEAYRKAFPAPVSGRGATSRAILQGATVHTPDLQADPEYSPGGLADAIGIRSGLAVPMMRDGKPIGTITVARRIAQPFTGEQIGLLQTFADQAVIAIENVRLFNETREALERQTATAEILKVIASSPSDVQPVFDAIAKSSVRLMDGFSAAVFRFMDDSVHLVSLTSTNPSGDYALRKMFPRAGGARNEVLHKEGRISVCTDVESDTTVSRETVEMARARGWRSRIMVPMIRDRTAIGYISVTRVNPGPFGDHQVGMLKTFADQAVIAIENVRLFNETREALERQTATAEILKVIASSPSELQPVFDAIVGSALRLMNGATAHVTRLEAETLHLLAFSATDAEGEAALKGLYPVSLAGTPFADEIAAQRTTFVSDAETDSQLTDQVRSAMRARGVRSSIRMPMVLAGKTIGTLVVNRKQAGPFPPHEIELLRTFADQAVIAIENARLFNETKEALERQTATAEILKVISSSPTEVQPVFDAIVETSKRLLGGFSATVTRIVDDMVHLAAYTSMGESADLALRSLFPARLSDRHEIARSVETKAPFSISDRETDSDATAEWREMARQRGFRSVLFVPMLRAGTVIGTINVTRREPGAFGDHQVGMLKTFADQAVIAIENVRLFKELEARTEALTRSVGQLTALGEVGQAISSTLDVETVLKTVVSHAVQLTGLDAGVVYEYDAPSGRFDLRASQNFDEEGVASLRGAAIRRGEGAVGTSVERREPVQVPDTHASDYPARLRELLDRYGYRALLAVPLLREDNVIGALMMTRRAPGAFAPGIVELLQTFASQSALAIQNARLFREIAEKGRQLEEASRHKSNFLASMSHELRTPLNAILGFNEMILGQVYGEVPADIQEPLTDIQTSGKHLLRLINNVLDLAKIEAGRMELSLQDYSVHDAVESVRATLRPLAAEKGLEFVTVVPQDLPLSHGDSGRITQCLMNLAGNSVKFTRAGRVEISVVRDGELLRYSVVDTGIGIPQDKIAGLFSEFKQTDATIASEYGGTGLGLSITKKFIEMHGGRIWIESEPGKGSAFIFEIPLRVAPA